MAEVNRMERLTADAIDAQYDAAFREICDLANKYYDKINPYEVGVVANGITMRLKGMINVKGCPYFVFQGISDIGRTIELIQYYKQINVSFVALDKLDNNAPRARFGFSK